MPESLSNFSPSASATTEERLHHAYDPKLYARLRFKVFPDDFVLMRNPLNRPQTALVHLGPPPGSPPPSYAPVMADPDDEPTERELRQQRAAAERAKTECAKFSFAPGESILVPRELVRSFVSVRNGVVVGGLLPLLQIPGDPHPPELGPAFLATDPFEAP